MVGILDKLSRKAGVIYGEDVKTVFDDAHEKGYALASFNCTSSPTVVAVLEAARDAKAPIMIQISSGGAAYFAGKGVSNEGEKASIAGSIAAAHYVRALAPVYGIPVILHTDHCAKKIVKWLDGMLDADEEWFKIHGEPIFSSHMIDYSEESDEENIGASAHYFKRMAKMGQWLEMEIGITGGEEDGVDNTGVHHSKLYTTSERVYAVHEALSKISPNFSIAAAFGNVHGVYKPGNVKLRPELLAEHQAFVKQKDGSSKKFPLYLVFHGGSGSSEKDFETAIVQGGVVKVNIDTQTQYAFLEGIRDYMLSKKDYVLTQVGNPEGADKPNKKYYDPRVWVREGEKTEIKEVSHLLHFFNAVNKLVE